MVPAASRPGWQQISLPFHAGIRLPPAAREKAGQQWARAKNREFPGRRKQPAPSIKQLSLSITSKVSGNLVSCQGFSP
jgi:hypothetical protein